MGKIIRPQGYRTLLGPLETEIAVKAVKDYFNDSVDIFVLLSEISGNLRLITNDRNKASHGELIGYDEAKEIRAKVYKNEIKKELNPSDFLIKVSKNLK